MTEISYRVRQSTNGLMNNLLDKASREMADDCFDTMALILKPKQTMIMDEVHSETIDGRRVVISVETIKFLAYSNSENGKKIAKRNEAIRKSRKTKKVKKG